MRYLLLIAFTFLLASCGPSEGDIYENRLTQDRVEILSVGSCGEILKDYKEEKERLRANMETGKISPAAYTLVRFDINNRFSDSTRNCVGYSEGVGRRAIVEKGAFSDKHQKIN